MPIVENSVEIDRHVSEVFAYVTTAENDPHWVQASVEHSADDDRWPRPGATSTELVQFMGTRRRQTWTVRQYEPERRYTIYSADGLFPAEIDCRFEPLDAGGTQLTLRVDVTLAGPRALLTPVLVAIGGRQSRADLARLKRLLERASSV